MQRRMLGVALSMTLSTIMLSSCGDNSQQVSRQRGSGSLYILFGDAPLADMLAFHCRVTGLTLTPKGEASTVTVFSGIILETDFAALRDLTTVLNLSSVQESTYDEATITFSYPQLVVFDPSLSPPIRVIPTTWTTLTPTVKIEPPLTVVKDKVQALRLDFDVARSIELDAQGHVTGNVTPVLKLSPATPAEGQGIGNLDNLTGFIRSVSPFSQGQDFTGSFSLQLLAGSDPAPVTVYLTKDTQLFGAPALNQVETGRFVEVEAFINSDGNTVAETVEVQERTFVEENKVAFLGYVTSLTKDGEGKVTQFDFYIHDEEPDVSSAVPLDSILKVSVAPSTVFQNSSRSTNFANLVFGPSAVAVGQQLVVHGKYTKTTDQPTTVDPSAIYLRLQTLQGSFSSLVQVGADGKTGAFWFAPGATLFQGVPALVFTTAQTAFLNVFGLTGLIPQPTLLVMGLPFYERDGGTINGVTFPPGTLVVLAKQVHQLQ